MENQELQNDPAFFKYQISNYESNWYHSDNPSMQNCIGGFESRNKAIEAGRSKFIGGFYKDKFYVREGIFLPFKISDYFGLYSVLDILQELEILNDEVFRLLSEKSEKEGDDGDCIEKLFRDKINESLNSNIGQEGTVGYINWMDDALKVERYKPQFSEWGNN